MQIHSKKRNRLDQKKLNDLVFVKYNRALMLRRQYRDSIDPISLKNIDDSNEWLLGRMDEEEDEEEELVFEDDDLTWGTVFRASGAGDALHRTRTTTFSNRATISSKGKGKQQEPVSTSRPKTKSTNRLVLIDEEEFQEETDEEDIGKEDNSDGASSEEELEDSVEFDDEDM